MNSSTPTPRVKVYGFLSLTRRQYVATLVAAALLLLLLLPLWFLQGHEQVRQFLQARLPAASFLVDYVPWIVLAAVLLEGVEAYLVLRKFQHLHSDSRQRQLPPTP
jgi:hypothetical protein